MVLSEKPLPAYEPELTGGYAHRLDDDEEVYSALVIGLRAYLAKNGFRSVLVGLSGGIDSSLVAAIACDALGAEHVYGVSMPSKYSSGHSRGDAAELARRTGLNYRTVSIEPMFDAYMGALGLTGLAEENLQARLRGTALMALSNQEGHLVLAPGNKSELAVGYSTLYGDAVGAFGPIKDVYKSDVFRLARWRNRAAEERGQTRRSRRTRSPSRPAPSCGRGRSTRTRCRTTRSWTASSPCTWTGTGGATRSWPRATTRSW